MNRSMSRVLPAVALIAAILWVGVAAEAQSDTSNLAELMRFEGAWVPVAFEFSGQKGTEADLKKAKITFTATGKWKYQLEGKHVLEGHIKVDPTRRPKTIDYFYTEDFTGGGHKGKASLGIYEIEGDNLRVYRTVPGKPGRPIDFVSKPDSNLILTQFKRERPK